MNFKILLADDHAITRAGIKQALDSEGNFEIVAEAEDGRNAIDLARVHQPDIAILDISMPVLNGIDAACQILEEFPKIKIIFLSMHSDKRYVQRALQVGVSGYILKDCAIEEISLALKHINRGGFYLSPSITGIVVEGFRQKISPESHISDSKLLTPKEREVLQMVAEGCTSKEIADRTHVSIKTIEARRRQIMEKLDIHSIAELTKYAIKEGLTSID